jgi:hypothetical protein
VQPNPLNSAPLERAVSETEAALLDYNTRAKKKDLLSLVKADFTFKTGIGGEAGANLNLFVFKLGVSGERELTHTVTFTYEPKKEATKGLFPISSSSLREELIKTIEAAAAAIAKSPTAGGLPIKSTTIEIEFGLKWEGTLGVNVPIQLVTIGADATVSKTSVQSVALTFEKPNQ